MVQSIVQQPPPHHLDKFKKKQLPSYNLDKFPTINNHLHSHSYPHLHSHPYLDKFQTINSHPHYHKFPPINKDPHPRKFLLKLMMMKMISSNLSEIEYTLGQDESY